MANRVLKQFSEETALLKGTKENHKALFTQ